MPIRLGIELSPAACRIVEIESNPQPGGGTAITRIRSWARLPREGVETRARLSTLQRVPAAAVVWGLGADHRHVVVERRAFGGMRREAVAAMRSTGIETKGRVADIFAAQRTKGVPTRAVVVALASTPGIVTALRWLAGEGVRVESIVTPALALMSLARLRRELAAPDRIEAYVVLEESAAALALVRNGLLLAATEFDWGFQDDNGFMWQRDEMADRLADAMERFLAEHGARPRALGQVCICGGLPELRSMAMRLTDALDVEVEPLDSLFGIDAARLPEPEFADRAVDFRLAWAAAADWPSPINLLRERNRRRVKTVLTRAAVAAGVVTGVGVAWQVQREWWRSAPAPARPRPAPARAQAPAPRPVQAPAASAAVQGPPAARATSPPPSPPPSRASVPPPPVPLTAIAVAATVPPSVPPLAPQPARPPAGVAIVQAPVVRPPASQAPVVRPGAAQPAVAPPPVAQPSAVQPSVARLPVVQPADTQPLVRPRALPSTVPTRAEAPPPPEIPLPFDAVLGSILYAPERKLAIVDGRIVQPGDDVNGARIVDITPTSVLLRDAQGRLRRLGLGAPAR